MNERGDMLAKLSKNQKKKKSAQKKKLAKRDAKAKEEQAAAEILERQLNEADARIIEQLHDRAMCTRDFQMLNIRGKLLAHPSKSFLTAFTSLRLAMCRDTYPNRVHHARRLFRLSNSIPLSSWLIAMGTASTIPDVNVPRVVQWPSGANVEELPTEDAVSEKPINKPGVRPRQEWRWLSFGVMGLMVWYPVISTCMATGDKLACIALRDTCSLLRTCYGMFRNDITTLEQFVFDARDPTSIKQIDWVALRVEVPPSPPQTPPHGYEYESDNSHSGDLLSSRDSFRSPVVMTKRWADYDDDESLGSPMSLPITPESSGVSDVPVLDINESGDQLKKEGPHRVPTTVIAAPTLTDTAYWFSTSKTVLPVPRLSLFTFEDFPRRHRTSSGRPMKLQSSAVKYIPESSGKVRVRARLEHWVREGAEKNLKAKLSLGLSSTAKKMIDVQAESVIFNRVSALADVNSAELRYAGEPDILGAGVGLSVEEVCDVVTGRFRSVKNGGAADDEDDLRKWSEYWSKDGERVRVMLVPSAEGWICRHLDELRPLNTV